MKIARLLPALAGLFVLSATARAQFADSVLSYQSGAGFAAGFTNATAALGAPTLGSGVEHRFAPPFSKSQLVSIGAGGEITLQMDSPVLNTPANPYGLDFIIFANSFFIQNGGEKRTNGSERRAARFFLFNTVSATIQVSADNVNWYTLDPALAPQPGEWFPTYGGGSPLIPVNPALMNSADFAGADPGAGGIALQRLGPAARSYSLSWAQDASGNSVRSLASADYVRIEVTSGVLDMDPPGFRSA